MKKKLLSVAFAATMLFMTSCNRVFYQVYTVQSDSLKQQDNSLVFENDDCKVFYNLWSNSGDVSFAFVNKTDKDIFINMGQTFFIVNGKAKDYYQERTFGLHDFTQYSAEVGTGQITLETDGYWGSEKYYENMQAINNAMKVKKSVSTTNSFTIKEKEIICIPANSYKILCKCSVNPVILQTCIKNKDFPNRNTNVGSYDKKTTPLVLKNRIAYGFNKDEIAEKYVESDFWLSSVDNYSQKAATEEVKTKIECYGLKHSEKRRTFKIGGPNMFYQVYSKYLK